MRLDDIARLTLNTLLGALLRRAAVAAVLAIFAITALYQFTVASTIALELEYGPLNAHLIVGAIYLVLAAIALAVLWAMRPKSSAPGLPALGEPRQMQLVMLAEAVMLGYTLARKNSRAR
ncbi:MAG: hypothetical protein ACK4UO_11555 [Pseudolabrys sp.]